MKKKIILIPCIMLLVSIAYSQQNLEVEGQVKIGTTIQNNTSNDILVLDPDGVVNKRDVSTISAAIPSSAIVLSETDDNPDLLSNGYEYLGTTETTSSLVGPPGVNYGEWINATNLVNAPIGRRRFYGIWTGTEMIVWGGFASAGITNTGGKYNPTSDSWIATTATGAPVARNRHSLVWTGTEMIVWGGYLNFGGGQLNTGGKYNPSTDSWIPTSLVDAPSKRYDHSSLWTGTEMIVWGGSTSSGDTNTGYKYNPSTDIWTSISTINAPSARNSHDVFWTGSEMIIYGGSNNNTGAKYDPDTDTWTTMSTTNAPIGNNGYSAIWTGTEMIIWGGYTGVVVNTGAKYDPMLDSWTITNTLNVEGAERHSAIWTGTEMIVWGGNNSGYLDSGSRYNVGTDSWTPLNTAFSPDPRLEHTAIWTGDKMIIWGGVGSGIFDTGAVFDPSLPGLSPAQTIVLHLFKKI